MRLTNRLRLPCVVGLALALCCLAFLGRSGEAVADQPSPTPKRVLLVGKQPDHPYGTHMYLPTCRLLAHCLEQTPGVETVVSDGWPNDSAGRFDAIVVYSAPIAHEFFTGPHRDEVTRQLDQGAGLVTLHWATGVKEENWDRVSPVLAEYQGGRWLSHSGQVMIGESTLLKLKPDHPVSRGWELPLLRDEWYLNPIIAPGATPQWQVDAEGETLVVAWSHTRQNGGRAFAITVGHFWENFTHEPFRRAVVNAILWSAKIEVPPSGAPVDLTEEVLRLPPREDGEN